MTRDGITYRLARPDDIEALRAMQERSMRGLCLGPYTRSEIESFLAHVGTMDPALLQDGTYFLAEAGQRPVGSAGWSQRPPGYARAGAGRAAPASPRARIRSVYVDPDWTRRGIASRLMHKAEDSARAAGHLDIELAATLTGVPLYRTLGYQSLGDDAIPLVDGEQVRVVRMAKRLLSAAA